MPKKIKIRGIIGFDDKATIEYLETALESAGEEDVILEINSPGGLVFDGLEMANLIRNYAGKTTARVVGLAASMASYIPMMADNVEVEDNAIFMIHNPMSFAIGDYQEVGKTQKLLKSLARLLGRAYIAKTGKLKKEITKLMDETTFFFGEEIVEEGFADRVIKTKKEDTQDRVAALFSAQDEIKDCEEILKVYAEESSINLDKIAALLGSMKPNKPEKSEQKPMTWKEFLEQNPDAKAEYDADMKAAQEEREAAKKETEKSGEPDDTKQDSIKEAYEAALPVLTSNEYPEPVKKMVAAKAQNGDTAGVNDIISLHDTMSENLKQSAASDEQGKETPANDNSGANINPETTYQERKQRLTANYGV